MTIYDATIPVFEQLLGALSAIIDKAKTQAEARKIDPAVLIGARLRPDMLPFAKQVQIACDWAKNVGGRVSGAEPPKFEDNETSLDDLKARIAKTLEYLRALKRSDIDAGADRTVVFPLGQNNMKMKGSDYAFHLAMPNFFFHVTTAYGILRHNGIELGKRDFMGVTPGVSPA
ncbi:MAG TPA: DUF1993 domain-containing protein [Roseiarcus sp.]|jgi:hypothetical protein|nr:DUF1993 domain-containing protein [Roseiarcus sp.]